MKNLPALRRDRVISRLARALRQQIGRGRRSLVEVARAAEVEPRALRSYLAGERMMPLDVALRLCAVMPPRFMAELLVGTGYRPVAFNGAAPSDAALLRMVADATAALARAREGGAITPRDREALRPVMADLAACAAGWAEQGRAG